MNVRKIALGFILAASTIPAFAGRPLTTEDAGFIDKGGFELESYYHRETEKDTPKVTGFHIQPSAGIGFNTQLGLGVDFTRAFNEDFGERKSSGEYALVGKTGIKVLTDDSYGIAIAYSVNRTRAPGDSFRYDSATINNALTISMNQWLFHVNLGWERSRLAQTSATTWAIAAERTGAMGPVNLAVETYGNDHDPAWVQFSARWAVKEDNVFIDASYGQQLGSTRAKQITLGLKLAF